MKDYTSDYRERLETIWKNHGSKPAKKITSYVNDVESQIEETYNHVLTFIGVASRQDLERLNKKLNEINRKVKKVATPKKTRTTRKRAQ